MLPPFVEHPGLMEGGAKAVRWDFWGLWPLDDTRLAILVSACMLTQRTRVPHWRITSSFGVHTSSNLPFILLLPLSLLHWGVKTLYCITCTETDTGKKKEYVRKYRWVGWNHADPACQGTNTHRHIMMGPHFADLVTGSLPFLLKTAWHNVEDQAEGVAVNGAKPSWRPVMSGVPRDQCGASSA